jgi:hypothetical protein
MTELIAKSQRMFLVNHNGQKEIMPGSDIAVLQQSGSKIKIIRPARPEEIKSMEPVVARLDQIAGELEAVDPRLAMALDKVSDSLEALGN